MNRQQTLNRKRDHLVKLALQIQVEKKILSKTPNISAPDQALALSATPRKLKLGPDYLNHDIVFAATIGTPIQHRNFDRRHFSVIRDKANLPKIRLYDLRHTKATLLLSARENPKVVSERLGHASVVLTLDTYSHVLPTMQKNATAKIERLMFGT